MARPAQPARPAGRGSRRARRNTGASGTIPGVIVIGGGMQVGYFNPQRDSPELVYPAAGANPAFRTAALNAWSVYTTIIDPTPAALVLGAAHLSYIAPATGTLHIEIATGAAGAEVTIAAWDESALISGTGALPVIYLTRRLPPVHVAPAARLSYRTYWEATAGAPPSGLYLALYPYGAAQTWDAWDDTYPLGDRATLLSRTPAVGAWTNVPLAPTWTQLIAAAPSDLLLHSVTRTHTDAGANCLIEIGTGHGGAEVARSLIGIPGPAIIIVGTGTQEPARKLRINTDERVVARAYGRAANIALNLESI